MVMAAVLHSANAKNLKVLIHQLQKRLLLQLSGEKEKEKENERGRDMASSICCDQAVSLALSLFVC